MDRFKTEVASELGVNLKEGYNGDLTSKRTESLILMLVFTKLNEILR